MFRAFPSTHNSCRRRRLRRSLPVCRAVSMPGDADDCIEELLAGAAAAVAPGNGKSH